MATVFNVCVNYMISTRKHTPYILLLLRTTNNTNNLMFKVQKCYKRIAKKKKRHHHHHHHHHHCGDHDDHQLPVDDCEWRPSYLPCK
uniref:Uncharacterized protein n=1 Tax=Glossina palpalis gambiensis TaxID=67801 RepID=A0A1B0BA38_9MUSC